MLDYGAAVAIKFASSNSAIKDMTPAEYGEFLRNDPEYVLLIDNATCRPAERAKVGWELQGRGRVGGGGCLRSSKNNVVSAHAISRTSNARASSSIQRETQALRSQTSRQK